MAMATKSVPSFTLIFILVLVIFEVPEIKGQDSECLKEYGGDVGFPFCAPRIFPTICDTRCRAHKGAKSGKCIWGGAVAGDVKCLCDYCYYSTFDQNLRGGI